MFGHDLAMVTPSGRRRSYSHATPPPDESCLPAVPPPKASRARAVEHPAARAGAVHVTGLQLVPARTTACCPSSPRAAKHGRAAVVPRRLLERPWLGRSVLAARVDRSPAKLRRAPPRRQSRLHARACHRRRQPVWSARRRAPCHTRISQTATRPTVLPANPPGGQTDAVEVKATAPADADVFVAVWEENHAHQDSARRERRRDARTATVWCDGSSVFAARRSRRLGDRPDRPELELGRGRVSPQRADKKIVASVMLPR